MKTLSKVYTFLVFTILYIPIIVLVLFSFNSTGNTGSFSGPSLYWYRELFSSPDTFNALKNTLILAISTAVISTIIGTAAVVGIEKMKSKAVKGSILSVTNIPMMNPEIVTGISMMLLFVFVGGIIGAEEKLGFNTILIAHITPCARLLTFRRRWCFWQICLMKIEKNICPRGKRQRIFRCRGK